jgi:hypothetical protein
LSTNLVEVISIIGRSSPKAKIGLMSIADFLLQSSKEQSSLLESTLSKIKLDCMVNRDKNEVCTMIPENLVESYKKFWDKIEFMACEQVDLNIIRNEIAQTLRSQEFHFSNLDAIGSNDFFDTSQN